MHGIAAELRIVGILDAIVNIGYYPFYVNRDSGDASKSYS
jgi:hypothetical protein